jgi:phospholipid/cholesterol/gamma-HCH transport system ATP-binding protein
MISIRNLTKRFGDLWVSRGIDLDIPAGQMTCIIGRSGEGKSVFLKQLIGLIKPSSGTIIIDGIDITKLKTRDMGIIYKKVGYVFQAAALLDSLTIFENIGLPFLEEGHDREATLQLVKQKLPLVNLKEDVLDKYPSELSGGMRKRVGLARTLMMNPSIILYDEPTTGLDPITSRVVHELMRDMQVKLQLTSVVISHDIEIFKYADNVALLHEGKIQYFGDAKTIWECENPYIYQFIRGLAEGPIQMESPQRRRRRGL